MASYRVSSARQTQCERLFCRHLCTVIPNLQRACVRDGAGIGQCSKSTLEIQSVLVDILHLPLKRETSSFMLSGSASSCVGAHLPTTLDYAVVPAHPRLALCEASQEQFHGTSLRCRTRFGLVPALQWNKSSSLSVLCVELPSQFPPLYQVLEQLLATPCHARLPQAYL